MMNQRLMQAYRQAPWRTQIQRIAIFMLILITVGTIAGLYLNISARAATVALQIRDLQVNRDTVKEANSSLEADLASVTTAESMRNRAKEMGYGPVDAYSAQYLIIPEYPGRQPVMIAPPPSLFRPEKPLIRDSYTKSLWDWFLETMTSTGGGNGAS